MNKIFFTGHVKEINADQRTLTAYASTRDVDRDNEVILPEAWIDSVRQQESVPLLWAHEYRVPPVGKAQDFIIDSRGLKFTAQFANTDFANEIWGLYRDGFLDSFSVGFQPKAWETGEESIREPRRTFTEADLFEISAVPVPANPHARVERDFVPVIGWKSVDGFSNLPEQSQPDAEQKRGRVLSAANEKKIRGAVEALNDVLSSLGDEPEDDDGKSLFIVGKYISAPSTWEFQGVFSSKEVAEKACTGEMYFVAPATLGAPLPDDPIEWVGLYYPHFDNKTAIPYRDQGTADEDEAWKAPILADFTETAFDELSDAEKRRIAAHYTWSANMPPEAFGDLKLPHHKPGKSGVGPAVWRGVAAAAARMMQSDIPEDDMAGCKSHIAAHYEQFDKEPPEMMRAYSGEDTPIVEEPEQDSDAEPNNSESPDDGDTHDASEAELQALAGPLASLLDALKSAYTPQRMENTK